MRNIYHDSIVRVLSATVVRRGFTWLWFGQQFGALPVSIRRLLDDTAGRNHRLGDLQSHLYHLFYCPGEVTPGSRTSQRRPAVPIGPELERANRGQGYWASGWQVRACDPDAMTVAVRRGSLTLQVGATDCVAAEAGLPEPGALVSVRFQKDLPHVSPGFYMAMGDRELRRDEPSGVLRLYWNLTAAGAVRFMEKTTEALNAAELPFTLKALDDATKYTRCDAVVLYIHKDHFRQAAPILEDIHQALDMSLRPATPALTRRLAAGVGLAESPPSGLSFGMSRCRALAEGMLRAHEANRASIEDRLQSVEECFVEDGIDFESPYLNLGSIDRFEFVPRPARRRLPDVAPAALASAACLEAAAEIGRTLARQALWHDHRCNWIGATLVPIHPKTDSHFTTVYRSLAADLYAGTSGIALFMAELAKLTGDPEARRTAIGAMRHALAGSGGVHRAKRFGYYSGVTGIVCAAARIGTILGEESLLEGAARLLAPLADSRRTGWEFDVMVGKAGGIVGLLQLSSASDPSLAALARQLGDELLKAAECAATGCSWRSRTYRYQHNLLGFSHGTAGVAFALLELYRKTGEAAYREAAENAFSHERRFFDNDVGNWPDFREESQRARRGSPPTYQTFWCHGAPGIALSRLRAYQITGKDLYRQEAETALDTTRAAIVVSMEARRQEYSLCHGLPGNADVLISGHRVLGPTRTDDIRLAREVAGTITRRGGLDDIESPGLMLGLAGVGYFLLRLADADVPSVLLPPVTGALQSAKG